ncbi:solute:Na+ symporter, SSS family [Bryocella elongata]|uniref:Solute:Na+ symporter, SSS family n=1 Tax=Bryocella elongata TaxID=863522 RepID=A0A1H6C7V2_9BACT|nr:sodium/solute symporter [Bryocella elongata]SEG68982.1 solute:Na+ symporter, SSS family [Bryocella elongata]
MNTSLCLGALCLYLVITLVVGSWTRRYSATANSFLYANRSLPLPVVAASYLAANSGALEAVGLGAMAAQYGVQAFHFYWIGAIPALVVVGLWIMPLYRRSGVLSIPEWLELRYGPRIRLLNACMLLVMLPLLGGIGLYASSLLLQTLTGVRFITGLWVAAGVVLAYVLLGGIRATMYTEVLQLLILVAGFAPLAIVAARRLHSLPTVDEGMKTHLWTSLPLAQPRSAIDVASITLGLGFVLSFGYWCTDFVLMQRAFAARTDSDAQKVPLLAGFGKLLLSMLVVLPGLAAARTIPGLGSTLRFDQATPAFMQQSYGPILLALGFTAISASLTSALSSNVTAFGAVFMSDVYRRYVAPARSDRHYLLVGRTALVVATFTSVLASYLSFHFGNLMEQSQLIFATFAAPFWAVVLFGFLARKVSESAALIGFFTGTSVAIAHYVAFSYGYLPYGSNMTANFYSAIYSFSAAAFTTVLAAQFLPNLKSLDSPGLLIAWKDLRAVRHDRGIWILSLTLVASCALLNYWWR